MAKGKLLALIATIAIVAEGGEFRTKWNKSETVTLVMPRPADVVVNAKSLAIQFKEGQFSFRRSVELTQFVQQDLAKEFDLSNSKPDAVLAISVIAYEPVAMTQETRTEMRNVNIGTAQKPQFERRSVPVVYRLAHGSLTGSIFMSDKSGRALDSSQPVAKIDKTYELTVNGKAPETQSVLESLNPLTGFRKPAPASKEAQAVIETPEGLETQMLQSLASEIQKRYVSTADRADVFLAVDSELRLGDKLAESGQWKEALDSWTAASMKKNPADRTYNMAVAKEALAYASYAQGESLDEFLPKFQEAMDLYSSALHADPSEKYMRQAVDRLQIAKDNIEATRRMKVDQDAATARAARQLAENARKRKLIQAALADRSPDSPAEASFRTNVRTALAGITGEVTDAKRDELVGFGERLQLRQLRSYRVVSQEIARKKNISQALADYELVLKPLAADGKISPAERIQLNDLAQREDLDAADVKTVEGKYKLQEAPRGPAKKTPRAKPVAKASSTDAISQ